jgi:uncharacterized membrane protein
VPALFVGCMLSNLTSPFFLYDVVFGSLTSLLAAFITYMVGRFLKNDKARFVFGGIPPVLLNALIIPLIIVFLCGGENLQNTGVWATYFSIVASFILTQTVWVYGLGAPLYFTLQKRERKN